MLTLMNSLARQAGRRSDVIVASFLLLAVAMMIVPLPTQAVDVLVSLNIAFAVLILVVAFYSARAVDFSVLPPVILLSTLFRLSLSITTTRLILKDADAGRIVAAFGEFVIAGDVVVGLVVFLIITVAQFVVITKGAERVAEVGARFSLDAMPGKQMSIDTDLRNGDIDQAEARARRSRLERESQLFGAMDGAMKFVKGDAIACLVILCVNLLGGIVIGTLRHGMSFGDAVGTYSLLTVGDGLIAQLPALLTAVAAGIAVTRVASDRHRDLGAEIVEQMGNNARALGLTAAMLAVLALVPGFPPHVFLGIALVPGLAAYALWRRGQRLQEPSQQAEPAEPAPAPGPDEEVAADSLPARPASQWEDAPQGRLMLCLHPQAAQRLSAERLRESLAYASASARDALGVPLPDAGFALDTRLDTQAFGISLDGVPVAGGILPDRHLMLRGDAAPAQALAVPGRRGTPLVHQAQPLWVPEEHRDALTQAGAQCATPEQALGEYVHVALLRHAPDFVGIQETRDMLAVMEHSHAELVKEALRVMPVQRIADVLRRLLDERVSVRNLRAVLEALVQAGTGGTSDAAVHVLSERVRAALARQLCHQHADAQHTIAAYVLSRPLELAIRDALKLGEGKGRGLPVDLSAQVVRSLQPAVAALPETAHPVLMVAADIRRYLRQHLLRHDIDLPVMAYSELVRGYTSHPLLVIGQDDEGQVPESLPGGSAALQAA
ncbi:hypothetical protein CAL18_15705 [Bordetella genomosp. 7]|uniref:type III secretion system export apparatus subunit SctV n=1 Tax=Bordetella genomosp. 7 TaxID=1416805 RepID=UPI000BC393C6|nr:type III secretion system export apparatus subunit SctV [Bordetella genomosp. 7]OZI17560.1 hypothetical protein CAL18_15705 [Bordetella genomosp. 7]